MSFRGRPAGYGEFAKGMNKRLHTVPSFYPCLGRRQCLTIGLESAQLHALSSCTYDGACSGPHVDQEAPHSTSPEGQARLDLVGKVTKREPADQSHLGHLRQDRARIAALIVANSDR